MSTEFDPIEICRLASRALDGAGTRAELTQLETLLSESAEARKIYYRLIALHSQLAWTLVETGSALEPELPAAVGQPIVDPIETAGSTPPPVLGFLASALDAATVWLSSPKVLAIALAGGLATYFVVLTISLAITRRFVENRGDREAASRAAEMPLRAERTPVPPGAVGALTADRRARWAAGSAAPAATAVELGRRYELASGSVNVELSSGTQLSIAGPAVWRVASAGRLQFTSGKLIAYVPPRAVGFTVATPNAEVVDLGTEFGLAVDESGTADVHVFRGQVELKPSSRIGDVAKPSIATNTRVSAGQSRRIEASGQISVVRPALAAAQFLSDAPSKRRSGDTLDLVDLLAGGDGNGRRRNVSIDPRNGNCGDLPLLTIVQGDNIFHATPQHSVLDGCFIPNGPLQIDSAGHRFDFPPTSGQTCYHFFAGQRVSWLEGTQRLAETDYGADGHGFLFLNPNKGLTLDLAAIRRLNGGAAIQSLVTVAGNCIPAEHLAQARPGLPPPEADLFVLIDGQLRFKRERLTPEAGAIPLEIPIEDSDRFLTIAATEGGDSFWGDWLILGDPRFVLRQQDD